MNEDALKACNAIIDAHTELFCGQPLMQNGKPIDHTKLNEAFKLAVDAIESGDNMPVRFPILDQETIEFIYKNHRGEISERTVTPQYVTFADTPYHRPAQWIMHAHDHAKGLVRNFAMRDMRDVRPLTPKADGPEYPEITPRIGLPDYITVDRKGFPQEFFAKVMRSYADGYHELQQSNERYRNRDAAVQYAKSWADDKGLEYRE